MFLPFKKQNAKLRSVVSQPELQMIIHAFILTWLVYCNCLFISLSCLWTIYKWSRMLLLGCEPGPAGRLASLFIVSYLSSSSGFILRFLLSHIESCMVRHLCKSLTCSILVSAEGHLLVVPHSRQKTKDDHALEAVTPTLWNSLPIDLHLVVSVDAFKKQLKTHSFKLAFVWPFAA